MDNLENVINWKAVSRHLAGNETSIQRNRIPKKYQKKVDELLSVTSEWAIKTKNNDRRGF